LVVDFIEGIFTNVDDVGIDKVKVEIDSNALREEEIFEVTYASGLFKFCVLIDFLNLC
jgi:hypothetical protein